MHVSRLRLYNVYTYNLASKFPLAWLLGSRYLTIGQVNLSLQDIHSPNAKFLLDSEIINCDQHYLIVDISDGSTNLNEL